MDSKIFKLFYDMEGSLILAMQLILNAKIIGGLPDDGDAASISDAITSIRQAKTILIDLYNIEVERSSMRRDSERVKEILGFLAQYIPQWIEAGSDIAAVVKDTEAASNSTLHLSHSELQEFIRNLSFGNEIHRAVWDKDLNRLQEIKRYIS